MRRKILSLFLVLIIVSSNFIITQTYVQGAQVVEGAYSSVFMSDEGCYVLSANGDLWVWGNNYSGQLGVGTMGDDVKKPVKVMDNVKECVIGEHSVFLKRDGSLWTCGSNREGGLANSDYDWDENATRPIHIMDNIISIETPEEVIDVYGNLWAWGDFGSGTKRTPVLMANNVKEAMDVYGATLFIKNDGTLWGYGSNKYNQLGENSRRYDEATKILDNVEKISYYNASIAAIGKDKSLWTWGDNDTGQLGIGTRSRGYDCSVPTKILDDVINVKMGEKTCAAIKSNGELWCWGGSIDRYIISESNSREINSPQKISIDGVKEVFVENWYFDAFGIIRQDDSMWIAGQNKYERYRHVMEGNSNVPVQVLDGVKEIYEIKNFIYALKNDGTLWLWGSPGYQYISWDEAKILDNVYAAGLYEDSFWALKNDGTLWTWGVNTSNYMLGNGTTEKNIKPTQILSGISLYGEIIPLEIPVTVKLNGRNLDFDVPPVIEDGRTLVPVRAIFEAMGMTVDWNGVTSTVTAIGNGNSISMRINETTATVNGKTLTMDVPSKVINGRTLVPVRFIAESLGAQVEWDDSTKTVGIIYHPATTVPLILTNDEYMWMHTYINPNYQEYMWDYNEVNIFGSLENAEKVMKRIGFGALAIVGATKFYDLFIGWDYSVVTNADEDVYDSLIEKMVAIDEKVLESSTQKNIEAFLNSSGDLRRLKSNLGSIEKIYKDVYKDGDGFGIQLLNESFDKGLEYILVDNLSDSVIDALSKYLTIKSLYDAYEVTGESFLQLLNCMEADGYDKEFVRYAKEKLKCYNDIDSLVIEACKAGAESSLRSLIKKTIQQVGKKGVEVLGAKLDISKEMKDVFNSSSWQAICAKIVYGIIESSPTVKAADNYVILMGMKTLDIYSKYYFSKTVDEVKSTNDFYSIEKQKKIKNLAVANLNTSIKCRELLISLLEVMTDPGWAEYIERLELKNEVAYSYMSIWNKCEII